MNSTKLLAIDDFVFADWGISPAMIDDQSAHLSFSADRRSGVGGSVFFSGSSSPASWHAYLMCPDDASTDALLSVLATTYDHEVRLLGQREAHDETTLVTNMASITSVNRHSSLGFEVTFEAGGSFWHAETVTTVSKSFASPLDHALHVPSPGNGLLYPIIRLTPTEQRASQTEHVGWSYRQRWTITNNGDEPLFRYPMAIVVPDTDDLVTGTKALASGDDFRVWLDGIEQSRTLLDWNTASTQVWVILPSLPVGASLTYDLVYGNPEAGAPPTLAYPEMPAFYLDSSSNGEWLYKTDDVVANAGLGLWSLDSSDLGAAPDFTVPGAWRPSLTFENPTNTDEILQSPSTRFFTVERQQIAVSGTVSGGTYTITVPAVGQTTAALAYNANAATIQAAINALPGLESNEITIFYGSLPGTPITLYYSEFGQFFGQNTSQITINSSLTGGGTYVPSTLAQGAAWMQSTFQAARWRGRPVYRYYPQFNAELAGSYPFDGVTLYNPFGISRVQATFTRENWAKTMTVVTTTVGDETASDEVLVPANPATRLVLIGRQSGGDEWNILQQWRTQVLEAEAVSVSVDFTLPLSMKHVGMAIWPSGGPSIPDDVEGGGWALLSGDVSVSLDASPNLQVEQAETEVEMYELATELRLRGGANAVGPYHTLLVGNARSQSGAGTPRAAVVLGDQGLQIDTARHTHDLWDTGFLSKEEVLSAHTVRALDGYLHDGETGETRASRWLPVTPPRRSVTNGDFAVDISSWELYDDGTGITYTATHDATIGGEQNGSLKIAITVNSGSDAVTYLNSQFFDAAGQESVSVSAWVRTSHANVRPRLCLAWYASKDDAPISVTLDPGWESAPATGTGYTRTFAAAIPDGAAYFRVGVSADTSSSATGNNFFDDITINDNLLFVSDVSLGEVDVSVRVAPNWVP